MEKNIEIKKIILFDDKGVNRGNEYVQGIKMIMERSLCKAKTLSGFSVAGNLMVEFYFLDEKKTKGIVCGLIGEEEKDWYDHLVDIFDNDEDGYLVLCDYGWGKGKFEGLNKEIYKQIKKKKNVVFVCYTSVDEHARDWLETIMADEHECKIMDILLTMPKNVSGKIRSVEEAILDEW